MKKNNYRLMALTAVFIFLSVTSLMAQTNAQNATPEKIAEVQTKMLSDTLMLDSAKNEQLYQLNLKYANKLQDLKSINDRKKKIKEFRAMNNDKDKEMKDLLSDEQYKVYLGLKQEMQDKMKQRMQERRNNK